MKKVLPHLLKRSQKRILSAAIFAILLLCTTAANQSFALSENYRATLKGLKQVYVYTSKTTGQGTSEDSQFKTRAELRLRQAGLKISDDSNWEKAAGKPQLSIIIGPMRLEVILFQDVFLARNPKIKHYAGTWQMVVTSSQAFNDAEINEHLARFLDEFVNDYLSANIK